jgi:hypothetical protein
VSFTPEQVMLTLAGLAYRGFHDLLPGDPHGVVVRRAVQEGLDTLAPVRGEWELVWGPVTSRLPLEVFDSNAMYVVRNRQVRHRHVVALRGTHPISSSDWLFGDFLVGKTVRWPFATDGSAISLSTALGFTQLQDMRARPLSAVGRLTEASLGAVGGVLDSLTRAGRAAASGVADAKLESPFPLAARVEQVVAQWGLGPVGRHLLRDQLERAAEAARVGPERLRRTLLPAASRGEGLDLLTFLRTQADESGDALEVALTGHSKGGALAATMALWLQCALESPSDEECWDPTRRARLACYSFAGPTAGNAAFVRQLDARLGARQRHVRNAHDLVAQVWEADGLRRVPGLWGPRTAPLGSVLSEVFGSVPALGYRHARVGASEFAGELDPDRSLALEVIQQHMYAYLAALGLREHGISAVDFFV